MLPTQPKSRSRKPSHLPTRADPESATDDQPLLGRQVLLLEDNLIVALEAEDLLRALGAASVSAISSIAGAIGLCNSNPFDFAVLDINLGFENSLQFADRLRRAKVPFLFASGYGDHQISGESRISELIVSKPYDRDSLNSAIALTLLRAPLNARERVVSYG